MLIIDAHLDLAWNALQWNRNLQQSVHTIRTQEGNLTDPGRGQGTVALPEMRKGRVALCFATLLARSTGQVVQLIDYASPEQAHAIAQGQLAYYHALNESNEVRLIKNLTELNAHIHTWEQWEINPETAQPPLGLVISMESADPIMKPNQLPAWKEAGLRIIGPAHYGPGRYAGGTSTELGLTPDGLALLREMKQQSHNNCRALVPHQRQFNDEQIRAIVERDGVIGAAFDNWMIRPGWVRGAKDNERVIMEHVADHIDHICQFAGNANHAAIGSDLDGGFGREQSPADLDTIADLQKLVEILARRGYNTDDISLIMHGNWLRLLRSAWKI